MTRCDAHVRMCMHPQAEAGKALCTQIASLQGSLDQKFAAQQQSISELKVKMDYAQAHTHSHPTLSPRAGGDNASNKSVCACTVS
jgi:hypothetical protein